MSIEKNRTEISMKCPNFPKRVTKKNKNERHNRQMKKFIKLGAASFMVAAVNFKRAASSFMLSAASLWKPHVCCS